MATATTARPAGRHPWLDAFVADPAAELDRLLSGHARVEPYESADAPDAARLLFGGLSDEDKALGALDRAVNEWLDSQRAGGVPELNRLPLERWVRKVSEALEIIGLLKLPYCSLDLRQRYVVWNSWAGRLAVSAQRDGRHSFLRTLALTQHIVAEVETTVDPFALESLWLRVCEQAGSAFPKHYLDIGLLGLRMLPERKDAPPERPWMAGLVCWAIGQKPSIEEFSRKWWALRGLYPRMPSYWRRATNETLRQHSAKKMPDEIKDWWLQDVAGKEGTIAEKSESQPVSVPEKPSRYTHESLLKRAKNPLHSIRDQIEAHICKYRRNAEATGDSYHIVRAACKIGKAIIEGADNPIDRGQLAVDLARQALAWEPANMFAWALWCDALAKQGAFEAAELVGWEAISRFPDNVQWRNQLALLLADLPGCEADAEHLLRETIERFPGNVFARSQLALLLADLPDREADAEHLLRESIERFPGNVVVRNQLAELLIAVNRTDEATGIVDEVFSRHLENAASFDLRARLLYHSGDVEATRNVLEVAVERFSTNPILRTHIKMLNDGRPLSLRAEAFRSTVGDSELSIANVVDSEGQIDTSVLRRARLWRLLSECRRRQGDDEWRGRALAEVRRALSEDSNLAYARYLSRELEGGDKEGSADGSFAIAFIDALQRKDPDRLSALERTFSGQTHFVDLAKVFLFRDRAAADRAFVWFTQEVVRSEPRTVSALRGFLKQRIGVSPVKSSGAFMKLIASNDNIKDDLIESVLAGDDLLLAA